MQKQTRINVVVTAKKGFMATSNNILKLVQTSKLL